jgi:glucose/arabinose dehydrogenase
MKPHANYILMGICLAALFGPLSGRADTATLSAVADTFINSGSPGNSAGGNPWFDAGTDGQLTPGVRRSLLRFDLSSLPPGSTITSAVVQLTVTHVPGFGPVDSTFDLRRLTAAWGEGTNSGNSGAPAVTGDATWTARILGTANWMVAGALSDAAATASASTPVGSTLGATYQWSGAGLLSDVQLWMGNSSQNFGWLLRSQDEGTPRTVRGFAARESGANVPTLQIGYTSPLSVTITNPADNSVFGNTDSLTIGASATDTGGSVTNVQFFDGLLLLRSLSTPPYSFSTGPFTFALGLHTLTAVAMDNFGTTATSAPVHFTVARYTPEITNGLLSLFLLPVATNMAAPDYAISPPGDTHRLFVVEQNGLLRIIQDGTLLPGAALDIQSRVQPPLNAANPNDERGFLGLAFHPGFNTPASPGYHTLYTYNSELIPTNTGPTYPVPTTASNLYMNVINEWKISTTNDNVVDPDSRRAVISFGKNAGNHNGGTCTFGPDGYLYLALGDGGNANDVGPSHIVPTGNAQNLITPLGKMLRFDPLNPALNPTSPDPISPNGQYRIPTTNPFQGPNQAPEIYALGLRNPYRFSFDPVTGDLIEADVGQNNIEEINRIVRGGNYGWAIKEGDFLFNMTNGLAGPAGTIGAPPGYFSPGVPPGLADPITGPKGILEYDHNNGISITGGFVYRGTGMPELYGKYIFGDLALIPAPVRLNGRLFYADLQLGTINVFTLPQFGSEILPSGLTVHGFGQDANGELYALATNTSANGNGGVVYKLASVRLTFHVSGNLLDISWPVPGGRLQTQTNSPGAGIGSSWVTFPGSTATNHVVVPIDPANGSVFYRLAVP